MNCEKLASHVQSVENDAAEMMKHSITNQSPFTHRPQHREARGLFETIQQNSLSNRPECLIECRTTTSESSFLAKKTAPDNPKVAKSSRGLLRKLFNSFDPHNAKNNSRKVVQSAVASRNARYWDGMAVKDELSKPDPLRSRFLINPRNKRSDFTPFNPPNIELHQ
jgi:hypothetical protein